MTDSKYRDLEIIGIDHGYGNMKTRNTTFRTGIYVSDTENAMAQDVVKFKDKYLIIGENHKLFDADKVAGDDYYYLTIAALAKEMRIRKITTAKVVLAVGLPMKWAKEQREAFRQYLMRDKNLEFEYKGIRYTVGLEKVYVFMQGYVAIASRLGEYDGINYIADIGNGTINVMYVSDHRPNSTKYFTDQLGVHRCIDSMQNAVQDKYQKELPYEIYENFLINGDASIPDAYKRLMEETAKDYVSSIVNKLKEHGYDPEYMKLVCMGGGAVIVKRYLELPGANVEYIDDIRATAKGYENAAIAVLRKEMQ